MAIIATATVHFPQYIVHKGTATIAATTVFNHPELETYKNSFGWHNLLINSKLMFVTMTAHPHSLALTKSEIQVEGFMDLPFRLISIHQSSLESVIQGSYKARTTVEGLAATNIAAHLGLIDIKDILP